MTSLSIAIDSQIFCTQTYGGISRYYTRLAMELVALKQRVHVFAPIHRNAYLNDLPPEYRTAWRLPYCPPGVKNILRPLNHLLSTEKIRNWKPDILHESYFSTGGYKGCEVPSVVTVYDMIHELFPGDFGLFDLTSRRKKGAVERAAHVICISENTRKDLVDIWGIPPEKTSVIHLGHDRLPDVRHIKPLIGIGKPYILYVANRSSYKNFSALLKAYAISPRIKRDFRIVAFGGGRLRPPEFSMMAELEIAVEDIVQISGTDHMLARAYREAAAFVYPSLYEGFGLSPLEAMGLGCPVISSNSSCMPEILGDAAEYFDPAEPEQLAVILERVLYDEARINKYRQLGYAQAAKYSWADCASRTLDAYSSIVESFMA